VLIKKAFFDVASERELKLAALKCWLKLCTLRIRYIGTVVCMYVCDLMIHVVLKVKFVLKLIHMQQEVFRKAVHKPPVV
jgi:hypothetical protein